MNQGLSLPQAIKASKKELVFRNRKHNLFVSLGKYLVIDFLIGETRTGLTYHALGTIGNTPLVTDTVLGMEASRNSITSKTRSGTSMVMSTFFSAALSTFYIRECGLFGNGATSTANSGTLFTHYLQPFDNSDGLNDVTVEYIWTL